MITVLLNLNYRLIELNNEFGIDSYKFFGFKYFNDAVMFSSSSSQTGGIIFFADKIYFRNIFFSLFVNKNKKLSYMEKMSKQEFMEMLREEGKKAGIEPVKNLFNEDQRIEEVKRLGILDLNLSS